MGLENLALAQTDNFPLRHEGEVHSGKVRSVYWLTPEDSARLANTRNYSVSDGQGLGVMIISDRISAFDCIWKGEEGLRGVPGKGAALNAISNYWFNQFNQAGLAGNHILEAPHPLVWIVQKAEPIKVEAIARQYITGSMWRAYSERGARNFCGISLPDGLNKNQRLPNILITPTTKGVLKGIPGVPEKEDTNITRQQIIDNHSAFGFDSLQDVDLYERNLVQGFELISAREDDSGEIFVDTKFEFGYVNRDDGSRRMIYIDEVGTPDSSRNWNKSEYAQGRIVENSKEGFRGFLLATLNRDILLTDSRMPERKALAASYRVPVGEMMKVSDIYTAIAEKITGRSIPKITNAYSEIMSTLSQFGLAA